MPIDCVVSASSTSRSDFFTATYNLWGPKKELTRKIRNKVSGSLEENEVVVDSYSVDDTNDNGIHTIKLYGEKKEFNAKEFCNLEKERVLEMVKK